MKDALADTPPTPFRVAPGIEEVTVNGISGEPVPPGSPGAILEAFKAGTAPGEANAPIGGVIDVGADASSGAVAVGSGSSGSGASSSRGSSGDIGEGTGGLY
jgi:penicillin-binding protein 1A